jgi:release factor glutamine methyltransferase
LYKKVVLVSKPYSVNGLELWQWWQDALVLANRADVATAELDYLLREVAGLDRLTLRLQSFREQPSIYLSLSLSELMILWEKRINQRVPLQYLLGVTDWRDLRLQVAPGVLIPRPETECLIDIIGEIVREYPDLEVGNWVDLGTGSGAIALGLARQLSIAKIHAVDASQDALVIAKINCQNLGLDEQVKFYQGSWWQPLEYLQGKITGMVSNPPYIPHNMISDLQPEVREHEPVLALDGGTDGLSDIRYLINTAPAYLISGGVWLIEMMAGQANMVEEMLIDQGSYHSIKILRDLEGVERFILAFRK